MKLHTYHISLSDPQLYLSPYEIHFLLARVCTSLCFLKLYKIKSFKLKALTNLHFDNNKQYSKDNMRKHF